MCMYVLYVNYTKSFLRRICMYVLYYVYHRQLYSCKLQQQPPPVIIWRSGGSSDRYPTPAQVSETRIAASSFESQAYLEYLAVGILALKTTTSIVAYHVALYVCMYVLPLLDVRMYLHIAICIY